MHSTSAEGERGLELLREAQARGEPYDVALLDMEMPGMDGLELASAIRAAAATDLLRPAWLGRTGTRRGHLRF